MVEDPAVIPVTTPLKAPTSALLKLSQLQVPPLMASGREMVAAAVGPPSTLKPDESKVYSVLMVPEASTLRIYW